MVLPFGLEETFGAATGFGTVLLVNLVRKRPPYTSIYKHIAASGIGFYLGHLISKDIENKAKEKMVYLEDYVRLHPDDFIETPRKWAHVLQPWAPAR
ncbi:hypothetical protein ScPMuIL_011434 [Solemya velum]